jgi:hypothetical protein
MSMLFMVLLCARGVNEDIHASLYEKHSNENHIIKRETIRFEVAPTAVVCVQTIPE